MKLTALPEPSVRVNWVAAPSQPDEEDPLLEPEVLPDPPPVQANSLNSERAEPSLFLALQNLDSASATRRAVELISDSSVEDSNLIPGILEYIRDHATTDPQLGKDLLDRALRKIDQLPDDIGFRLSYASLLREAFFRLDPSDDATWSDRLGTVSDPVWQDALKRYSTNVEVI